MVTGVVRRAAVFYTLAFSNITNAGSDLGAEKERERLGATVLLQAIQFIRFETRKTGSTLIMDNKTDRRTAETSSTGQGR